MHRPHGRSPAEWYEQVDGMCEWEVDVQEGFLEEARPESKFVHSVNPGMRKLVYSYMPVRSINC